MSLREVGAKARPLVAMLSATAALFLALWIVIPGPTYFFLRLSVGAPEVSAWLGLAALALGALALADARRSPTSRFALGASLVTLGLSLTPFLRFPGTARRLDAAMASALGSRGGDTSEPGNRPFLRERPLVVADLFRGIDVGAARVTRALPVAAPDGFPLTADVYQPIAAGPHPIVVQIYGGAWQRGSPAANARAAQWLAANGYVVFAIDYRHAPRVRWPVLLDDVRTGLAWVREHADAYGADTSRVALMGRSAGAHLSMMAAYTPGPLPVRAVVSYYGPVDLVDAYLHPPRPDPLRIREIQDTLFGGTLAQMRDRYQSASPIEFADRPQPPTLLVYAGRDHIVERRYGARMHERLTHGGTNAVLLDIPWADHAFDEVFNGPSNQLALYHTERFLAWALAPRSRPGTR